MKELNEVVGEFTPDNLLLDPTYPAQVGSGRFSVVEEPTLIQRGQLLAKDAEGKLVKASAENKSSLSICLADTVVETGDVVEVLLAGALNASGIIVGDSEDVSDYKESLRANNIYIKNTIGGI